MAFSTFSFCPWATPVGGQMSAIYDVFVVDILIDASQVNTT